MLITLAKSLKNQKKASVISICLAVLEVVFEIIIPLCMSNLIDFGIEEGEMNHGKRKLFSFFRQKFYGHL